MPYLQSFCFSEAGMLQFKQFSGLAANCTSALEHQKADDKMSVCKISK